MMRRQLLRVWLLGAAIALLNISASARAADYGFDHVHLTAPDPVAAVAWYEKNLGGEKVEGQTDRLKYGTTLVIFQRGRGELKGTEGSSVDHIGFSFPDVAAKVKALEAAEVKVLQPVRDGRGGLKTATISDPWGTKMEIIEDKDSLGFHHVQLRGQNPKDLLDWYQRVFGGERKQFHGAEALKYGTVWIFAESSGDKTPEGTLGRSLDHLGWMIPKLDEISLEMKAKGVKFTTEPRELGRGNIRIAFVEAPGGVRIELVQR